MTRERCSWPRSRSSGARPGRRRRRRRRGGEEAGQGQAVPLGDAGVQAPAQAEPGGAGDQGPPGGRGRQRHVRPHPQLGRRDHVGRGDLLLQLRVPELGDDLRPPRPPGCEGENGGIVVDSGTNEPADADGVGNLTKVVAGSPPRSRRSSTTRAGTTSTCTRRRLPIRRARSARSCTTRRSASREGACPRGRSGVGAPAPFTDLSRERSRADSAHGPRRCTRPGGRRRLRRGSRRRSPRSARPSGRG